MASRHSHRTSGIFVKLFIGLWVALLMMSLSVWLISINYQQIPRNFGAVDMGRGAQRSISVALGIAEWGGEKALIQWLRDKNANNRSEVFVVDEQLREISGRPIPAKARAELTSRLNAPGVYSQMTSAGARYFFAVRTDLPPRSLFLALWRTPLWLHIVLALAATSLVAGALAWNFARPIRKLDWAMRNAADGNLSVRIAPSVGHQLDEIGDLAKQFDAMAEKINGLLARQRRLFHDVSHELRSPLARIEVAIALAAKSSERTPELLARIENDVHTLDTLVDELLTYARLDDHAPMSFETSNLVPLLQTVAENADFEGSAHSVRVALAAPEKIDLLLHIETFGRAVENLVRNALRFSPEHSTVLINAQVHENHLSLTIEDQGPGMRPEELDKLFLPFVRGADQSTGSGFGLGLAIAQRAVERHGGTLSARNITPHGLMMCIEIDLPNKPQVSSFVAVR